MRVLGGSDGIDSSCNVGVLSQADPPGEGNECSPLQYSCLENPMDRGSWRPPVHGVTKRQIRLTDEQTGLWRLECSLAPESRCGYWWAGSPALPLMCVWEPAKDLPVTATLQVVSKYGIPCIVFFWILEVCIKFCSYIVAVEGISSFSVRLSL